jgi:hypothetical protein
MQIKNACQNFSGVRGEHALKVVKYRNMIDNKLEENKRAVKQSVALTEKLRAAQIRYGIGNGVHFKKISVVF